MHTGLIELNWTSLMLLINVLILYLLMKRFFFEKIRKFMLARQDAVRDAFDSADQISKLADQKLEDYKEQIAGIESEGREIIKNAKIRADAQAKSIVDEANKKAGNLLVQAEQQVELEKTRAVSDMKEQIAALAVFAAEKIIERQLTVTGQDEIINEIIEQAGRAEWQN